MKTREVFDNGGKTFDRYTVIIDNHVYTMSSNPRSPQGVNMYYGPAHTLNREALGEKISPEKVLDLPPAVFAAIIDRTNS